MALPESPWRHFRSYGTEPLPTPAEALDLPLRAFPSWFLKITCDRCGKDRMLNESDAPERQRDMPIRVLLARARHDGLWRQGRKGRAAHRHRRRFQPPGAAHRAAEWMSLACRLRRGKVPMPPFRLMAEVST